MFAAKHADGGFTLIELLIVLSILGLLVAVVVPNIGGLLEMTRQSAYSADLATIQSAVDAYYLTRNANVFPTSTGGAGAISFAYLVTSTAHLKTVPQSAAPPQGKGNYNWYVSAAGVVTSTLIPSSGMSCDPG
jgi:prepilin-type N-terminal cleavage/methylation domain-containing protein